MIATSTISHQIETRDPLRVLVLPSYYPLDDEPWLGIFFKEQAQSLHRAGLQVGVAYVETKTLRALSPSRLLSRRFQIVMANESGILTLRQRGWNPHIRSAMGGRIWTALTRRLVRQYIERCGRPDLIHAHNAVWAGNAARLIREELGIPYVITEHSTAVLGETLTPAARRVSQRAYESAECVITVGQELAKHVHKLAPSAKTQVVPNVIDTDFFTLPPEERSRDPFVFVSVGHLIHRKGFDLLLRAFAEQFSGAPGVRLRIGGEGPERPALQEMVRSLRLRDQVELVGRVSRERVRDLMWSGNAFVLASRAETFGVVFVEALATGIPIIATDCGGPTEIMNPGIGMMVPREDVSALGAAMRTVYDRSFDSAALRWSAESRFGVKPVTQQLIDIYQGVTGRPVNASRTTP